MLVANSFALAALGCVAQKNDTYEPGALRVEAAAARQAQANGDWQTAAGEWYAIFKRGGAAGVEACIGAANALCQLGDHQSARNTIEQGLERYPRNADLLEVHGDLLCKLGFRRAAESCYVEALDVEPDRKSALVSLARLRIELRMECAALPLLEHCIQIGGGDAPTFLLLGRAHAGAGHAKEAFEAYTRSFTLDDHDAAALLAAATPYVDERAKHRDPKCEALVVGWLQRAAEIDPQSTAAHYQLALLRDTREEQDMAIAEYRRAIETDPAFLPAMTQLMALYQKRGEHDKAVEIAKLALPLEKDSGRRNEIQRLIDSEPATAKSTVQGR